MADKIFGVVALLFMLTFVGIIIIWVPEPSLIVVCGVVMAMAAYDFYRMIVLEPRKKKQSESE